MIVSEMWMYGIVCVLVSALAYFLKVNFERVLNKLDEITLQRVECRESLPDRFASKEETKSSFSRAFVKLDDHEHRLIKLEKEIDK